MPNLPHSTAISPRDKAGFTLFGSALAHVVVIMGVGFTVTLGNDEGREMESIETTVASARVNEDVDDAETFAAVSQVGGGLADDPEPLRSPLPLLDDPRTQLEQVANAAREAAERGLRETFVYVELPEALALSLRERPTVDAPAEDAPENEGAEAMVRSPLAAQFDPELSAGERLPRQKFISSRTREHKYASYMEAWRSQVEQVGNANYPEEARERRLSGNLVLTVAIRADGSIGEIDVIRSSGQKVLDDAAMRIVMMAAPFTAFPEDIREEADVIHITRTWQFEHNSALIGN